MEDVFKIKTVNHTHGEVYVNAPLDREAVDRYLLKVRQQFTCSYDIFHYTSQWHTHTTTILSNLSTKINKDYMSDVFHSFNFFYIIVT